MPDNDYHHYRYYYYCCYYYYYYYDYWMRIDRWDLGEKRTKTIPIFKIRFIPILCVFNTSRSLLFFLTFYVFRHIRKLSACVREYALENKQKK